MEHLDTISFRNPIDKCLFRFFLEYFWEETSEMELMLGKIKHVFFRKLLFSFSRLDIGIYLFLKCFKQSKMELSISFQKGWKSNFG